MDKDWVKTRWYRAIDRHGETWCESSDLQEVRSSMRPDDTLQELWKREETIWEDVEPSLHEDQCGARLRLHGEVVKECALKADGHSIHFWIEPATAAARHIREPKPEDWCESAASMSRPCRSCYGCIAYENRFGKPE